MGPNHARSTPQSIEQRHRSPLTLEVTHSDCSTATRALSHCSTISDNLHFTLHHWTLKCCNCNYLCNEVFIHRNTTITSPSAWLLMSCSFWWLSKFCTDIFSCLKNSSFSLYSTLTHEHHIIKCVLDHAFHSYLLMIFTQIKMQESHIAPDLNTAVWAEQWLKLLPYPMPE